MQMDGEPWLQGPALIQIEHLNQIQMVVPKNRKNKIATAWIYSEAPPMPVSSSFSSSSHFIVAYMCVCVCPPPPSQLAHTHNINIIMCSSACIY